MSQGDYINHVKVTRILEKQTDLENVLSSKEYTSFLSYTLSNTIENKIPTYRDLQVEQGMEKCAPFTLCMNTNNRVNRVITMSDPMGKRGYTQQHGYNEYIVSQKVNNLIMPCKMFEACDLFLDNRKNLNKASDGEKILHYMRSVKTRRVN